MRTLFVSSYNGNATCINNVQTSYHLQGFSLQFKPHSLEQIWCKQSSVSHSEQRINWRINLRVNPRINLKTNPRMNPRIKLKINLRMNLKLIDKVEDESKISLVWVSLSLVLCEVSELSLTHSAK